MKHNQRLATATLLLLVPAATLICSGICRFSVPPVLTHPLLVLGGLVAALLTNLLAILHMQTERGPSGHVAALNLRIGLQSLNLAVVGLSCLLLGTILAYAFVENFRPR